MRETRPAGLEIAAGAPHRQEHDDRRRARNVVIDAGGVHHLAWVNGMNDRAADRGLTA
jgi:hypothetical protein